MKAYPVYLDFTTPRVGHAFHIDKEYGEFEKQFKVLEATIFCDPTRDTINKGDVVYYKLPSQETGMFRILEMNSDLEVENTLYCKVIFCGYFLGKPSYFNGFKEAWEKYFPPQMLSSVKPNTWKQGNLDDLRKQTESIYQKYDVEGLLTTSIIILGITLCCVLALAAATFQGGI